MIGGIEIRIPTRAGETSLDAAVRATKNCWPRAVFENPLTGERYEHFWQIPFGELEEVFVYRDSSAADLWDAEGAAPDACNTMIHLIGDEGLLTVVVDARDAAVEKIISAISSGLSDEIFILEVAK